MEYLTKPLSKGRLLYLLTSLEEHMTNTLAYFTLPSDMKGKGYEVSQSLPKSSPHGALM